MNAVSPALAALPQRRRSASVVAHPDAVILSHRNEFRAAVAQTLEINRTDGVTDEALESVVDRLNAVCTAIADSPPARTRVGRALKAAAAMHKLGEVFNSEREHDWPGMGEEMAWNVLSEIAGGEYIPASEGRFEPPRRAPAPRHAHYLGSVGA